MASERSILNRTNSIFKHSASDNPDSQLGKTSNIPFLNDATLSHFRVKNITPSSLLMSSLSESKEKEEDQEGEEEELRAGRSGVNCSSTFHAEADHRHQHHDDNKLMTMTEVISDPWHSQRPVTTYYQPQQRQHHIEAVPRSYHQHHHLAPSASISHHEYSNHRDRIPSVASVTSSVNTKNNEAEVFDEDVTEIDERDISHDTITPHITSPALDNRQHLVAQNNGNDSQGRFVPVCQYENPCMENTSSSDAYCRKTVSHIFGRNKTCTQLIPDELWIWYCRKHYQRCRYKVGNWALRQVEIVCDTLDNFERWGNIASFNITLRKREQDRYRGGSGGSGRTHASLPAASAPTSRRRTAGRLSASKAQKILHKARVTSAAAVGGLSPASVAVSPRSETMSDITSTGRRKSFPVNVASPVPGFLYGYLGEDKSFNDVRFFINQIGSYVSEQQQHYNKEVSFPDIEILPNFTMEFLRSKGRTTDQLSENNHSRRRRARDVRLSRTSHQPPALAAPSSRIGHQDADGQYHASDNNFHQYHYQLPPVHPPAPPLYPPFHPHNSPSPFSHTSRDHLPAPSHTPSHHEGRGHGLFLPSIHHMHLTYPKY